MPLFSARWNALAREAGIASYSISSGLESLRKANYAYKGLYNHAFFGLSIGLERLLKLNVLLDFALQNTGVFPDDKYLRKFGHRIDKLFAETHRIHSRLENPDGRYEIAQGGIEDEIIGFLSRFATSTRYYNLDFLSGHNQPPSAMDPVAEWATKIEPEVLSRHYTAKARDRDQRNAAAIEMLMRPVSSVLHSSEDGTTIDSPEAASLRTGENAVMQKYGTFYCATIVRFAYLVMYDLEHECFRARLDDVPALHEFFFPFLNEDEYIKNRKTFPPRG